jgi:hypothetical protein
MNEIEKIRALFYDIKELTKSDIPIVRDGAIEILAILREILNSIDFDFTEHIIDYE